MEKEVVKPEDDDTIDMDEASKSVEVLEDAEIDEEDDEEPDSEIADEN